MLDLDLPLSLLVLGEFSFSSTTKGPNEQLWVARFQSVHMTYTAYHIANGLLDALGGLAYCTELNRRHEAGSENLGRKIDFKHDESRCDTEKGKYSYSQFLIGCAGNLVDLSEAKNDAT